MIFIHFLTALTLLTTSALVAFSTVPVNSIVFLVSTFLSAALMLFFFGVDFLSLIFIIVYVGAIAILFLFVIMMVSIKTKVLNIFSTDSLLNLLKGVWLYFFLFFGLISFLNRVFSKENYFLIESNIFLFDALDNILVFGFVLFNFLSPLFLLAGVLLTLSLVGSITLVGKFNSN